MMKKINKLLNCKGLTLVEILVAFAILGIITTAFLSLFTNGYKTIFSAGQKTTAVFKTQEVMEGQIAGSSTPNNSIDNITVAENPNTNLSINFGGKVIVVKGKTMLVQYDGNKHVINFTSFISENRGD